MLLVVLLLVSFSAASAVLAKPATKPGAPPIPVLNIHSNAELGYDIEHYAGASRFGNLTFGPLVHEAGTCLQPSTLGPKVDRTKLSNAQLKAYGLPSKPANPGAIASWKVAINAAKVRVCTHRSLSGSAVGQDYTNTQAGNLDYGYTFTQASANWTVPTVSCCQTDAGYAVTWVGIGDYGSNLSQSGTGSDDPTIQTTDYYAWYENYPHESSQTVFGVNPGDTMFSDISDGNCTYIEDVSTNHEHDICEGPNFSTTDADYIVERPQLPLGYIPPLTKFSYVSFTNTANSAPGSADSQPHIDRHMTYDGTSGGTPCATAHTWSNDSFSISWNSYCF